MADKCTGSAQQACPADAVEANTTVCRAVASKCDAQEKCDGTTKTCPADAFQPQGATCLAGNHCDGLGGANSNCRGKCGTPLTHPPAGIVEKVLEVPSDGSWAATTLELGGSLLFSTSADYGGGAVFDVSQPGVPFLIAKMPDAIGDARHVELAGTTLYVGDNYDGLKVWDYSSVANPVALGTIGYLKNQVYGVFRVGTKVYAAGAPGQGSPVDLLIANVQNPATPTLLGTYADGDGETVSGRATAVAVSGNYAYLNFTVGGTQVIDVSVPASPTLVTTLAMPGPTLSFDGNCSGRIHKPVVEGNLLHIPRCLRGIFSYSIANPAQPIALGNTYDAQCATDPVSLDARGATGVTLAGNTLRIYDLSEPAAPDLKAAIDLVVPGVSGSSTTYVRLSNDGHYAYVGFNKGGIQVFHIN